ncbi:MAG: NUDIX domain-containing protein [bacterium]|nr:NUDIX domain-containing protein [bacterium]
MKIAKLSYEEFIESFKNVPRAAISIAIFNEKEILLTKRREDPFKDFWHLPGSYIIKNESIQECVKRVLREELGFEGDFSSKLLFLSEDLDKDPRGHTLDLIYEVKIGADAAINPVGRTKELGYFGKIPANVGFNHPDVLKRLGFQI